MRSRKIAQSLNRSKIVHDFERFRLCAEGVQEFSSCRSSEGQRSVIAAIIAGAERFDSELLQLLELLNSFR